MDFIEYKTHPDSQRLATKKPKKRPQDRFPTTVPPGKVRFVLVSDTHSCPSWDDDVPDGDVLIHAGDLTLGGTKEQIKMAYQQIKDMPHKVKLVVAGNHDLGLDREFVSKHADQLVKYETGLTPSDQAQLQRLWTSREATAAGIIFLNHEATTLTVRDRKFSVFGSPYSPEFFDWAYMYPVTENIWGPAAKSTVMRPGHGIPDNTEILITHGPPKGVLDEVVGAGPVGCPFLLQRVAEVQPSLHVFGHIHEGAAKGLVRRKFGSGSGRETIAVNAALLDEHYHLAYRPTVIDL